jgi:hypothetical protein
MIQKTIPPKHLMFLNLYTFVIHANSPMRMTRINNAQQSQYHIFLNELF